MFACIPVVGRNSVKTLLPYIAGSPFLVSTCHIFIERGKDERECEKGISAR